ncbi:hypothetical protein QQ045_028613 [Rhodiola kirilowii]
MRVYTTRKVTHSALVYVHPLRKFSILRTSSNIISCTIHRNKSSVTSHLFIHLIDVGGDCAGLCLVDQVEAAYDMLLMQSLTKRRAGKVVSSDIRYADVKPVKPAGTSTMPQWLQTSMKSAPLSLDSPSTGDLGIQAGVYAALMVLTSANGTASSVGAYSGADVPCSWTGFSYQLWSLLAFMTKRMLNLFVVPECVEVLLTVE